MQFGSHSGAQTGRIEVAMTALCGKDDVVIGWTLRGFVDLLVIVEDAAFGRVIVLSLPLAEAYDHPTWDSSLAPTLSLLIWELSDPKSAVLEALVQFQSHCFYGEKRESLVRSADARLVPSTTLDASVRASVQHLNHAVFLVVAEGVGVAVKGSP